MSGLLCSLHSEFTRQFSSEGVLQRDTASGQILLFITQATSALPKEPPGEPSRVRRDHFSFSLFKSY